MVKIAQYQWGMYGLTVMVRSGDIVIEQISDDEEHIVMMKPEQVPLLIEWLNKAAAAAKAEEVK